MPRNSDNGSLVGTGVGSAVAVGDGEGEGEDVMGAAVVGVAGGAVGVAEEPGRVPVFEHPANAIINAASSSTVFFLMVVHPSMVKINSRLYQ